MLKNANDFRQQRPGFLLLLLPHGEKSHSRLGIQISKKHIKSAVRRNWLRRLTREVFRQRHDCGYSYDLLLCSRPGLVEQAGAAFSANVAQALAKLERQLMESL